MNKKFNINGKIYELNCNVKDNNELRSSFNNLTEKTYGFNFVKWYENGYWNDSYIPYCLIFENKVVSNVSVNIIDFLVLRDRKRFIQIGTVMTDEDYRNQGLSKILMEIVLEEWVSKCDMIYLFANDSVLDFYPKFGFTKYDEYQYSINNVNKDKKYNMNKINIDNKNEEKLVLDIVSNSQCFSKICMMNNPSLIMFYLTYFMTDDIYYIKEYNAIVICNFEDDILYINDVFTSQKVKLEDIISIVMREETKSVILGFTPLDTSLYCKTILIEEDTTLFVNNRNFNLFEDDSLMFPKLSHA